MNQPTSSMPSQGFPQTQNEPDLTNDELLAVFKHFYQRYLRATGINPETKGSFPTVAMVDFVSWCRYGDVLSEEHSILLVPQLGVRPRALESIKKMLDGNDFDLAGVLIPIWPIMVMQHRPPIKNAVQFCHVSTTIGFFDGRVMQLQGITQFQPGKPLTDGFLCAFVQDQSNASVNTMAMNGFDKLYQDHAVNPDIDSGKVQETHTPIQPAPLGRMGFKAIAS